MNMIYIVAQPVVEVLALAQIDGLTEPAISFYGTRTHTDRQTDTTENITPLCAFTLKAMPSEIPQSSWQ